MRALILAGLLVGCNLCPVDGPWRVTGAPVPYQFEDEVAAAVGVLQDTRGLCGGGEVKVRDYVIPCDFYPSGLCAGVCYSPLDVEVSYVPAEGLGPEVGTTALEHELCHASGIHDEVKTEACAREIIPKVKLRLDAMF